MKEKVPVMGQLSEDKMLEVLSQALKGDPGPGPTSELSTQLPGLAVPLGLEVFLSWEPHCFLGMPYPITTNLVASNDRNVFSHSPGGHKSKIEVSVALVPGPSPKLWLLPAILGGPWPAAASLRFLPHFCMPFPTHLHLCVFFSISCTDSVAGFRACPDLG